MKRLHWAILCFLALGLLKVPLEQRAMTALRADAVLTPPVDMGLRENLGQMSFAASLGGLRSLIASVVYLQAFTAWEDVNWGKVDSLMGITTRLQPKFDLYWDEAANYMGLDAASYYRYDESRPALYRNQLYRQHVQRGIEILRQGLQVLPESDRLWVKLGMLYAERVEPPDHKLAAMAWLQAVKHGALTVYERRAARELSLVDDDPAALKLSYQIMLKYYGRFYKTERLSNLLFGAFDVRRGDFRTYTVMPPTVVTVLKDLEQRLHLPPWQRIDYPDAPAGGKNGR